MDILQFTNLQQSSSNFLKKHDRVLAAITFKYHGLFSLHLFILSLMSSAHQPSSVLVAPLAAAM